MPDPLVEITDDLKRFIVQELACYETPSAVAKTVKEDFGITLSRQRVHAYDPTKKAGSAISPELKAIFEETRKQYLADTAAIGVANKNYRLRMLQRGVDYFANLNNWGGVADLLERAAKEEGGAFTNKQQHELSGTVNVPLAATVILTGAPPGTPAPQAVGSLPHKGD